MKWNNEKGGAVLITTVLILLIGGVLAIALLNSSRIGSRVSANYKLQENAFNVAEMGFERIRTQLSSFSNATSRMFTNPSDPKRLYDPNFNAYDELFGTGGAYGAYYAANPQFKGTELITLPDGQTLTGEWYVRVIDNDLICNQPVSGDLLDAGYLNEEALKTALALPETTEEEAREKRRRMGGIMLNCRELANGGGSLCNTMPTLDFSFSWDSGVFVESRGIIRNGNDVIGSRLVRVLVRVDDLSGGRRDPGQKGGSSGGSQGVVAPGTVPTGYTGL